MSNRLPGDPYDYLKYRLRTLQPPPASGQGGSNVGFAASNQPDAERAAGIPGTHDGILGRSNISTFGASTQFAGTNPQSNFASSSAPPAPQNPLTSTTRPLKLREMAAALSEMDFKTDIDFGTSAPDEKLLDGQDKKYKKKDYFNETSYNKYRGRLYAIKEILKVVKKSLCKYYIDWPILEGYMKSVRKKDWTNLARFFCQYFEQEDGVLKPINSPANEEFYNSLQCRHDILDLVNRLNLDRSFSTLIHPAICEHAIYMGNGFKKNKFGEDEITQCLRKLTGREINLKNEGICFLASTRSDISSTWSIFYSNDQLDVNTDEVKKVAYLLYRRNLDTSDTRDVAGVEKEKLKKRTSQQTLTSNGSGRQKRAKHNPSGEAVAPESRTGQSYGPGLMPTSYQQMGQPLMQQQSGNQTINSSAQQTQPPHSA